ncbi:alkaline shock response membrane anchor protein AmaP [Lactobacillus sp. CBA3605]|uniref:alkaline shock response membrane anchor protein AmaP n=1 Tax=Lactobacillus sp. CBA3605 TaxID=2099788 RepID=UPI000CFDA268|nr:alkaline shock response membrane anchor protein AmaP [Lactobacillus sp. CBA3605]AVK61085.1 alkaline shock response membrane anchor protein AmaP [Lactobacillus sp. CBA3605]
MSRITKALVFLVGLILLLMALFEISHIYPIPVITEWFSLMTLDYPVIFGLITVIAAAIVGLVGGGMVLVSIFRATRQNGITFTNQVGKLLVPRRALERDLQYQLVEQLNLIEPQVVIKLRSRGKTRARVMATVNETKRLDLIAQQVSALTVRYLEQGLGLKQVKPIVQLTPTTQQKKLRVV